MSDTAYYENQYEAPPEGRRWKSVLSGLAAATLSLSMLGAVVAWAYQISVRDAHDVPVIRAIEGPMKQRPEETGGLKLEEKDLAVTRMVSGEGATGAATLAPAGEQPAPEDKPVQAIKRSEEAGGAQVASPALRLQSSATADEEVVVASAPAPGPETPAGATPEPATGSTTGTPVAPMAAATTGSSTGTPVTAMQDPLAVTEQAPEASPPVRKRPETLDTTASASSTNTPVARQQVALGAPVIQLGAFTSRQLAERAWKDQRIINRNLFRGMEASITPVQSGGRELYRLRVGPFPSENEAKKVCIVIKARGADCIFTWQE